MIAIRGAFWAVARAPVPVPKYSNPKLPPNPLSFFGLCFAYSWRKFLRGSWTRNNPTPPREAASGMTPPTGALSTTYIDHFSAVKADVALCK